MLKEWYKQDQEMSDGDDDMSDDFEFGEGDDDGELHFSSDDFENMSLVINTGFTFSSFFSTFDLD